MREQLLTNDQMATAYGGYDFKTAEMKAVCRAQREVDLALFKEKVEKAQLTDDEIKAILGNYAVDICTSMPIKNWNDMEAIKRVVQAQLQKVLALLREETMRMDRFNDSDPDDIPLDYPEYIEGMEARQIGQPISANPYSNPIGSSFIDLKKRNRWAAGWADQDMMLRGDTES